MFPLPLPSPYLSSSPASPFPPPLSPASPSPPPLSPASPSLPPFPAFLPPPLSPPSPCLSLPPDDSYRVRLLLHPGVLGSDYMNASYVDVSKYNTPFSTILSVHVYLLSLHSAFPPPSPSPSSLTFPSHLPPSQGYQQRHQYILTQGPLKHTVDDFWRMVWEHRASTIMMLCQLEEKGKVRGRPWQLEIIT